MGVTICPMPEGPLPSFWAEPVAAGCAALDSGAGRGLPKYLSGKIMRCVRDEIGEISVRKPGVAWGLMPRSEADPVEKVSL